MHSLKDKLIYLAPMAGVTDLATRRIVSRFFSGILCTEMVSINALYYGDEKTKSLMDISDTPNPHVLQVFGSDYTKIKDIAHILNEHPSLEININMGCPTPKIVKNGDGCALMKDELLASKIIEKLVKHTNKKVSAKFRKGWDENSINVIRFARMCEESGASSVIVHGRTREQMYSGQADWEIISEVKSAINIPLIANGDIVSVKSAKEIIEKTNSDGIMIGRATYGNPWIMGAVERSFNNGSIDQEFNEDIISNEERLRVALLHLDELVNIKGEHIGVLEMRKHASWYIKGIFGSARLKQYINKASTKQEMTETLRRIFAYNQY